MYVDRMGLASKPVIPMTAEEHYARNTLNIDLPFTITEAFDEEWIFLMEGKSVYHSYWTPTFEFHKKFISPDGHREAVYHYETGELVTDPRNMWTYNYFNPITDPWLHKQYDVDPYFDWWNSHNDTTTRIERYSKSAKIVPAKMNQISNEIEYKVHSFNRFDFINNMNLYMR